MISQNRPDVTDRPLFRSSYQQCRAAFLDTAREIGAALESFEHPSSLGIDGEVLAVDVALLGSPGASRLLVMSSGTHGTEGFVGSALQLDTMRRLSVDDLDADDIAILLIHGVNPFGWSHRSRTNENLVDLNRNFVDFTKQRDEHPLAREIQSIARLTTRHGPDFDLITAEMKNLMALHGMAPIGDAIQCGQYFNPTGTGFGGGQPEWSNDILREIWSQCLGASETVCFIDWHTGLGDYGEPVFLCFDAPDTDDYRVAASWWGADRLSASDTSYQSGSRPNYSGLLMCAAQESARAKGAVAVGAVVEFGTFAPLEAARCLWIDSWLRNQPADADPESVTALRKQVQHFFYPNEPKWNEAALSGGRNIIDQALRGLKTVSPEL